MTTTTTERETHHALNALTLVGEEGDAWRATCLCGHHTVHADLDDAREAIDEHVREQTLRRDLGAALRDWKPWEHTPSSLEYQRDEFARTADALTAERDQALAAVERARVLFRQAESLPTAYTHAPGENSARLVDLLSADCYRIGAEGRAALDGLAGARGGGSSS